MKLNEYLDLERVKQVELAVLLQVDPSAISYWARGLKCLPPRLMKPIMIYLGISADELTEMIRVKHKRVN
jgi:DNA-binding transcriptional regulator YdaS (Cro superfamily)